MTFKQEKKINESTFLKILVDNMWESVQIHPRSNEIWNVCIFKASIFRVLTQSTVFDFRSTVTTNKFVLNLSQF